jgi:hypothetical protein
MFNMDKHSSLFCRKISDTTHVGLPLMANIRLGRKCSNLSNTLAYFATKWFITFPPVGEAVRDEALSQIGGFRILRTKICSHLWTRSRTLDFYQEEC